MSRVNCKPHPADGQQEVNFVGFADGVPQFPIQQVLPCKDQQAEAHGYQQHVEDASHVVNVQLAAHHFVLLVLADARQPHCLQALRVSWRDGGPWKGSGSLKKKEWSSGGGGVRWLNRVKKLKVSGLKGARPSHCMLTPNTLFMTSSQSAQSVCTGCS